MAQKDIITKGIPNVSQIFYSSDGSLLEKQGDFKFYAQSNYSNLLIIHLEDGASNDEINLINFTPKNINRVYTSHWFYLNYAGITEYLINGEIVPRSFATYFIVVPNIVLQNNQQGIDVINEITVVKRYGVLNLGIYNNFLDLVNEHRPNEQLMENNAFAYVLSGEESGFYQVELDINADIYVWAKRDNTMNYGLTQKQYEVQELYVKKGYSNVQNLPTIQTQTVQMIMQTLNNLQIQVANLDGIISGVETENTNTLELLFNKVSNTVFLKGNVKIDGIENELLESSSNGLYVKRDDTKLDESIYNNDKEVIDDRLNDLEIDNTTNKGKIDVLEDKVAQNEFDIEQLELHKLDKIWDDVTEQTVTFLNDIMVINRGNTVYKTTLANLLSHTTITELFVVVSELPTVGFPNKIYLLAKGSGTETQNVFEEWIWINNAWELIGSVSVDLSNYYNKTEINGLLENIELELDTKVDKVAGKGLSQENFTTVEKSKLTNIESGAQVNDIEVIKLNGVPQTITNKEVNIVVSGGGNVDSVNGKVGVVVLNQDDIGDGETYKRFSETYKTNLEGMYEDNYFKGISMNDTTYVITFTRRDNTTATIDLPLESVVVSGEYDNSTKTIILTLENGSKVNIPVGDLVSGLIAVPTTQKGETTNKALTYGGTFKVLHVATNGTITERTMTIPPAYTLPQATANTLGGIKAKERTIEMNEVAIDTATGKLYVNASESESEVLIDNDTIKKNDDDELYADNVAIWGFE